MWSWHLQGACNRKYRKSHAVLSVEVMGARRCHPMIDRSKNEQWWKEMSQEKSNRGSFWRLKDLLGREESAKGVALGHNNLIRQCLVAKNKTNRRNVLQLHTSVHNCWPTLEIQDSRINLPNRIMLTNTHPVFKKGWDKGMAKKGVYNEVVKNVILSRRLHSTWDLLEGWTTRSMHLRTFIWHSILILSFLAKEAPTEALTLSVSAPPQSGWSKGSWATSRVESWSLSTLKVFMRLSTVLEKEREREIKESMTILPSA